VSIIKAVRFVVYATKEAKLAQNPKTSNPIPTETVPKNERPHEEIEDLRVRRTRKLIQQAFLELTVEKGFATLTVQDIADRAMVNRSTFYRHYLDKYDLLNKYMDEVYELTSDEEFLADKLQRKGDEAHIGLLALLNHIQKHAAFYQVMLGPKGDPLVPQRLRTNTERRFQKLLGNFPQDPDPNTPPVELRISYISYAGVGAIKWWMEHQRECSPEQLARWLVQLSSASAGLTLNEFIRRANTVNDTNRNSSFVPEQ
jgi:AcrR family transcriptional regulator